MKKKKLAIKRWFDIAFTLIAILLTWPVAVCVCLSIWITMGTPILFRQQRAGYKGVPFILYKFRTMRSAVGGDGRLLSDSQRLTRLGRFLRKTSLDEWPQLWNVLRGDISLVGPRPLLVEYLAAYTEEHNRRHDMMPGITGWAQVNGRQALMHSQRRDLDVWYVDNWSFLLDLKILVKTVLQVIGRRGVRVDQKMSEVDDLGLADTLKTTTNLKVE